ncbi:NAD(P)/FAD-dependent oxidoreductase [Candidatus Dojkabacteria bacterium]|uniref:NAD(P)/FAD-dependent oxidoreductase n=1 Tax=Candidatus Dojkabacteria bacterium TaxID=2099670 RepID=A0A955RJT6_9BACT|nr:NAD(P)/FAD-dependent oxidoreductase [Candidatus Dojkabacteria bacterium]
MEIGIIGGGAAGIMAAIVSKRSAHFSNVTLIEKNEQIGKKILVCGAGRCNLTNRKIKPDRYYGAPKQFIGTVLNQFGSEQIIDFFENLGIEVYEEEKNGKRKGKIFPVTNQAATIVELLESELKRLGVTVLTETEVKTLEYDSSTEKFVVETTERELNFDKCILAAGGKTYPNLGATGIGYELAKKFGHTIIEPVPSAIPLRVDHWLMPRLSGVRITAEVTSIIDGEEVHSDTDEIMFTKFGITGPAILNISREISVHINRENKQNARMRVNVFPGKSFDEVFSLFQDRWFARPDQEVLFSLYGILPNKFSQTILQFLRIEPTRHNELLTTEEKKQIVQVLQSLEVEVEATRTWNEGEFTAGGVFVKEIHPQTMESKIIPNLFLAGEVVNIDGDVGGFNLSWAWASGYVAGEAVASGVD